MTSPAALYAYADGACRGNPGPSGAGWVLCAADLSVVARGHLFLGRRTNNEAEYLAAACALEAAHALGASAVTLRADSELLIRQVTGVYRVKNERLRPLFEQLVSLSRRFESFSAEHVRREFNAEADREANLAIDEAR